MSTKAPIEFWFYFTSAYAYFASLEIEDVAREAGRELVWRPFMLGSAFEVTGARGLSNTPLKREYALHDWDRIARKRKVAFELPPAHPVLPIAATRAFYRLEEESPDAAVAFAKRVFELYFTQGLDTRDPQAVAALAETFLPGADILAALSSDHYKRLVRQRSEEAVQRGVFGSPWMFVAGEPFWGWDRLPMLREWLKSGGW